jgi:hypothetical protein
MYLEYAFLDADGNHVDRRSSGWSRKTDHEERDYTFPLKQWERIARVRISGYDDLFTVEVPFEFTDVPIPRW